MIVTISQIERSRSCRPVYSSLTELLESCLNAPVRSWSLLDHSRKYPVPELASKFLMCAYRPLARPTGFEPATCSFGGCHSIQLSYGRVRESLTDRSRYGRTRRYFRVCLPSHYHARACIIAHA